MIQKLRSELEEGGGVTLGAADRTVRHSFRNQFLFYVVEAGVVQGEVDAVFAAELRVLRNLVIDLRLHADLSVGLAGITVIAEECVGVLPAYRRYIVDTQ